MTTAELKLGLTAAAMLLLLIGSIGWVVWDWLQARQKRKRWERREERVHRQFIASLKNVPDGDKTLRRCWTRLDRMKDLLADFEDEKRWEDRYAHLIQAKLQELRDTPAQNGRTEPIERTERINLDGYHYYKE